MAADKTATFAVKVPVETNAAAGANAVDQLRNAISASQDRVKGLTSNMRLLRGASDEVKAAKDKLKASIEAERVGISANALALDKLGATYVGVKKKTEAAAAGFGEMGKAAGTLGGPVASVTSKLEEYGNVLKTAVANPQLAVAAGAAALAVGIGVLTGALVVGAVRLGFWALEAGNALRTMGLFREAALGSAENSRRFGNQIEKLREQIPTTREELNKLAVDLSRDLAQARVSGAGIVDTFRAVAQESAAMGEGAGKQIEGIITRMKRLGRLGIGRFELQGTGIEFEDVAANLAKNTHKSIEAARAELRTGRTKLDDGAKAIKDTIEKRFGAINAKRMLDFNVIVTKTKERLQGLTKDINLEPILSGIDKLSQMFSTSDVTGQTLKTTLESIVKILGRGFELALPVVIEGFQRVLLTGLNIYNYTLAVAIGLKGWIGPVDDFKKKLEDIWSTVQKITKATGVSHILGLDTLLGGGGADKTKRAVAAGQAVGQGFAAGIAANDNAVAQAADHMAKTAVETSRDKLKIHSPSLVFREQGRNTARGYAEGVEDETPAARGAVSKMAGAGAVAPTAPATAREAKGGPPAQIHVHLHFDKDTSPTQMVNAVSSADFRAALVKAVEDLNTNEGIPISEVA